MIYRILFLIHLLLFVDWISYGQDSRYQNYLMYKRIGRDVIDLGLVGKRQQGEKILFFPYVKTNDSTFKIDTINQLDIKVFYDTSYYEKIRKGERIDFAYIPVLDFSQLGHWQNNSFYVDYNINLSACIIQEIAFPNLSNNGTVGIKDTVVFKNDFTLNHCTFNLRCEKIMFNGNVILLSPITLSQEIMPYYFVNSTFKKHFVLYSYMNERNDFWLKKYISIISLNTMLEDFEFSHCTFDSFDFRASLSNSDFRFENCSFDNYVSIQKFDTTSKLLFGNCVANSYFRFDEFDKYTRLENTTFRDSLDLYNIRCDGNIGEGFFGVNFKEGAVVILNPDTYNLRELNFNFIAIQKINFPFRVEQYDMDFLMIPMTTNPNPVPIGINTYYADILDEPLFDRSQNFYINLQKEALQLYDKQPQVINNLNSKFQYQAKQYERKYHRDQLNQNGISGLLQHGPPLIWLTLTELIVHNGYHGELNFFLSVLYTILFFSVLFFLFFQFDIINYFDKSDSSIEFRHGKVQRYTIKRFIKGLWQSTVIFINPKFPKSYFEFNLKLFICVCIEWLLGIAFIVLFFIFIATNYPFVKGLIGI